VAVRFRGEEKRVRRKVVPALAFCLFAFVGVAVAAPPSDTCNLPEGLQREIGARYPGSELVALSALDADDKVFFKKDYGDACPGLVKVDFYGDSKPTLALVLITKAETRKR